ncbi:hypothetical protein HPB50_027364 [Hyalomma asiaticum]|uniref:Uncharacterized protein n=1 Tax=Hyalomma asiaticum TaxID=266040 RepID=A0ACB7TCA6_HYAAI|nr:hypothetical protein HPB50_027364 [Hyalomma asiaticum]
MNLQALISQSGHANQSGHVSHVDHSAIVTLLWLKGVLAKNLPVSGDLLKENAETFAFKMGIEDFKFTNGRLRDFNKRHWILFKKVSGKSGAVDLAIVTDYRMMKLKALLKAYAPSDTFTYDEMGLFFKMLPDRTLAFSAESRSREYYGDGRRQRTRNGKAASSCF